MGESHIGVNVNKDMFINGLPRVTLIWCVPPRSLLEGAPSVFGWEVSLSVLIFGNARLVALLFGLLRVGSV